MIALIDGDSMFYVIAYNFKDVPKDIHSIDEVEASVDNFVGTILTLTKSDNYFGLLSDPQRSYFRHVEYKVKPYKGNRPSEEEWMTTWRPVIWHRLTKYWNFHYNTLLEADDLITLLAERLIQGYVICTPDKDLDQCPGLHFNYKAHMEDGFTRHITPEQAHRNKWKSILAGDSSDNIMGIPNIGEVKAAKMLDLANDPIEYPHLAEQAYIKYFGPYYGPIMFHETVKAITMLTTKHPCYDSLKAILSERRAPETWDGVLNRKRALPNIFSE